MPESINSAFDSESESQAHQTQHFNDDIVDTTLDYDYDTTTDTFDQASDHTQDNIPLSGSIDSISRRSTTKRKNNSSVVEHGGSSNETEILQETGGESTADEFDNDADADTDTDTEDESDEDEEPPKLKYSRLSKLPNNFFNHDEVSCSFFHEKVFLFATHTGFILLTKPDFTVIRTMSLRQGRQTPSVLSLHSDGEYFAAGANNGIVLIGSILDEKDITTYDFKRPIHAVTLDRQYKNTKSFVSGGKDGKVIYSTRNWLGQRSDTVLDEGNGSITMIKVVDDLLVWSNDSGLSIAQITARAKIHHEPIPDNFPQPEMYWPKVHYSDKDRIIIGWVNHLWFFRVSLSTVEDQANQLPRFITSAASSFRSPIEKKIEVERHEIVEDTLIAGLSEFNDNLMILNYILPKRVPNPNGKGRGKLECQPPELKILDRETLEEESVDEIAVNSTGALGLNDYDLQQYVSETEGTRWFLISPNDGIVVQEFNLNDQLTWYTANGKFQKAWEMSGFWLDRLERLNIGLKQVNMLISENKWKEAALFLELVLAVDQDGENSEDYLAKIVDEWNLWIQKFIDNGNIELIADYVPYEFIYNEEEVIDSEYYNQILNHYMDEDDFPEVIRLIDKWDHFLFDIGDVKQRIDDELTSYDKNGLDEKSEQIITALRKLYIDLCLELDEPSLCIKHLIILEDPKTIQFLDEHHLIPMFLDLLPQVLLIGVSKEDIEKLNVENLREHLSIGVSILVENSHEILPKKIVKLLDDSNEDFISFMYLEELAKVDKLLVKDLEDEMVKLFASYNRISLMSFLSKHNNYSIQGAIDICEQKSCTSELVYLLSKVGENRKALILIIDELKDPERAISFTNSVNDKELWDFLLDYSMSKPSFIRALMVASGDLIDPIPVISRIPKGVEIDGLKDALMKITSNIELDDFIHKLVLTIISSETMNLLERYKNLRLLGYNFEPNSHKKMGTDTIIMFSDPTKKLSTEAELLGDDHTWTRDTTDLSEKITHVSYIKGRLMLLLGNEYRD